MARGSEAKVKLVSRLREALGEDWIGEIDKKFYCWSEENGERIQIALAMTCPKTQVPVPGGDYNWDDAAEKPQPATIEPSEDEKATLDRIMNELGL